MRASEFTLVEGIDMQALAQKARQLLAQGMTEQQVVDALVKQGVFPRYAQQAVQAAQMNEEFAGAKVGHKAGPAGQLKARDKVNVKGTVLGSPEKSQKGLRGKLVGGSMEEELEQLEERRRKRRKARHTSYGPGAWGPGPYGGYGFDAGYSGDMGGGDGGGESMRNENMDHSKDDQAVPQLKAALIARKEKLQSATDDQVYDIIDKIMTRIAKTHGISGQKLHDMWVAKYKQVPDTWIMKENFADGRNPQDKGDAKRHGVNTKASVSSLRKTAKQGGRKGQLAHWMANMKSGKAKKK